MVYGFPLFKINRFSEIIHRRQLAIMKMFDSYGNVMVDVNKVLRKNDNLLLKGKIMNSMPGEFYLRPEEVWAAFRLISWPVIKYFPIMLIRGWWRARKLKQQNK